MIGTSLTLLTSGCYQPERSADYIERQDAALEHDSGMDANEATGPVLRFRVRTTPIGGRYAPRNVGAIWIEDASGTFIKTLKLWAAPRKRYLRRFLGASQGDVTDAITSATLPEHVEHEIVWDWRDRDGALVADGDYALLIETTDRDSSGDSLAIAFTKGTGPLNLVPMDTEHFRDMLLAFE